MPFPLHYLLVTKTLNVSISDERNNVAHTNLQLAREQRIRQEHINEHVNSCGITEDFFEQFNTTTR